jgi:hypothetical protein
MGVVHSTWRLNLPQIRQEAYKFSLSTPSFSIERDFHQTGNQWKGHTMRNIKTKWAAVCCAFTLVGSLALWAAGGGSAKTYQVTGPVLEVTPTTITVQKDTDKWELLRDQNTKVTGDLKVGAKVTIIYRMVAQQVEVKEASSKK